jgi:hypothetical protein
MPERNPIMLSIIFILFFSCGAPMREQPEEGKMSLVAKFVQDEMKKLKSSGVCLVKYLYVEGNEEQITIHEPDWDVELAPFLNLISDKVAGNSYQVDTIIRNGSRMISYSARDSSLLLRNLIVYAGNYGADSLRAVKSSSNIYNSTNDTLWFSVGGRYRISSVNRPRIGKVTAFYLVGVPCETRTSQ